MRCDAWLEFCAPNQTRILSCPWRITESGQLGVFSGFDTIVPRQNVIRSENSDFLISSLRTVETRHVIKPRNPTLVLKTSAPTALTRLIYIYIYIYKDGSTGEVRGLVIFRCSLETSTLGFVAGGDNLCNPP